MGCFLHLHYALQWDGCDKIGVEGVDAIGNVDAIEVLLETLDTGGEDAMGGDQVNFLGALLL